MWIYSAYASIGSAHERHHASCQDAVAVTSQNNILIGAIADGAGSTIYGGIGAHIAVEAFLDFFCTQYLEEIDLEAEDAPHKVTNLFEDAYYGIIKAIQHEAHKRKHPLQDFATTFIGTIATPTFVVVGHIGDGFAVVRINEQYSLAAAEYKKEFINQTSFITDPNALLQIGIIPQGIQFLAMGTDGLTDVCLKQKTMEPHPNFFKPFDVYLETRPFPEEAQKELAAFLGSDKLNARTQDDKSLLIARWVRDGT